MVRRITSFALPKFSGRFTSLLVPYSQPRFWHSPVRISLTLCCWLACLWLLAACGPESESGSDPQLIEATHQVALAFQTSNNLDEARNQLSQLKVANPTQWLVYVTESAISASGESNTTTALVNLAVKLELQTTEITRYATAYNLLPAPAAQHPPANVPLNQSVAVTTTAGNATRGQPVVVPVAQTAPLSNTLVITLTTASSPTVATSAAVTATNPGTTSVAAIDTTPMAQAKDAINVRGGPGVNYGLVGALQSGERVPILGKNPAGDWWEVALNTGQNGWVYSQLVEPGGDMASVVVAANIPEPPPPPTAAPVVQAPAAQPTTAPEAAPTTPAANPSDTPHFSLVAKRMWSKAENGDCRGQHLLRLHVLDANGVRLNGVTLEGIYTGEKIVTGSQGKGDGIIEYDLYNSGEAFKVITNNDGRSATSDNAEGFTTRSLDIDEATLIAGGYCSNHEDCQIFYKSFGCQGHHSWEATLKRNY